MRWAAAGAAVAVSLGAGSVAVTRAVVSSGDRPVFIAITPCRLFDTRPGGDNVGPRSTPLGAGQTMFQQVRGANGNCTIPEGATGVALNVTVVNGTASSFLTLFPADATRPLAASLNWTPGAPPTPNKVDIKLAADGRIALYNLAGSVDVVADAVGYYEGHDHDDRYYTKAQIDAVAGPVRRTISLPAQALNHLSNGSPITDVPLGIQWINSFSGGAQWALARPADAAGTGDVTLVIEYHRVTTGAGNVRFFARPQDWVPGEDFLVDQASVSGDTQTLPNANALQRNTISWPAAGEAGTSWNIVIQRDSTQAGAYAGDVVVRSVTLSYDATR